MPVIESSNTTAGTLGVPLRYAGVPTNNVTYLGKVAVGTRLVDVTNGVLYICTVSSASAVTWVTCGSQ